MKKNRPPKLPDLLARKIYKTGQTRGADDDVIYQNRVNRNSTVLIPFPNFEICKVAPDNDGAFERGYIVLIKPENYFEDPSIKQIMESRSLVLGQNALLFYETNNQWNKYNPDGLHLTYATSRTSPLGGDYIARVPSTTSENDEKKLRGFMDSGKKGAGIRIYEYASSKTIMDCQYQLEFLYWSCFDSEEISHTANMTLDEINLRRRINRTIVEERGLGNISALFEVRMLDKDGFTTCPLCLKKLSAIGFYNRLEQADGREVPDLTVTQLNLFHIRELRVGEFNHRPYNLGWGHHHCNVVTRDVGIYKTLDWMSEVLEKNVSEGYVKKETT